MRALEHDPEAPSARTGVLALLAGLLGWAGSGAPVRVLGLLAARPVLSFLRSGVSPAPAASLRRLPLLAGCSRPLPPTLEAGSGAARTLRLIRAELLTSEPLRMSMKRVPLIEAGSRT